MTLSNEGGGRPLAPMVRRLVQGPLPPEALARRCQVGDDGDVAGLRLVMASHGGCNSGHISPGAESGAAGFAVLVSGQAVTTELEMVVDPAVCGEETLGVAR